MISSGIKDVEARKSGQGTKKTDLEGSYYRGLFLWLRWWNALC